MLQTCYINNINYIYKGVKPQIEHILATAKGCIFHHFSLDGLRVQFALSLTINLVIPGGRI
jgi:hypothetical protein